MINKKNLSNKVLMLLTCILLGCLFLVDKNYRVNHVFALIFVIFIFNKFKYSSFRRMVYYIIITFSIMGAALSIPLGENLFLSRFNIYYLYIGIYILSLIIDIYRKNIKVKFREIAKKKINIVSILFMIYVFGSIIITDNKNLALKQSFIYVVMFMLFMIVVNENIKSNDRKDTLKLILYISFGIIILGSFKIVTAINIEAISVYSDYNIIVGQAQEYMKRIPTVFFYNPNDYALVVVLILLVYFGKIINGGVNNSRKYVVLYIIAQINLIYTSSRTGWISLVVAMFVIGIYFMFNFNKDMIKSWGIMFAVTIVVFVGLSYSPFSQPYYGKFKNTPKEISISVKGKEVYLVSINDKIYRELPSQNKGEKFLGCTIGEESSMNKRVTLIYDVLKGIFKEKRYLGFGIGNTAQYIMEQNNTYGLYNVHSFWFELLGDFGLIGFALFIFIYIYLFIKLIRKKSKNSLDNNICILVLVAMVLLVFGPSSVVPFTVFWISLAMVYSNILNVSTMKKSGEKEEKNEINK